MKKLFKLTALAALCAAAFTGAASAQWVGVGVGVGVGFGGFSFSSPPPIAHYRPIEETATYYTMPVQYYAPVYPTRHYVKRRVKNRHYVNMPAHPSRIVYYQRHNESAYYTISIN